MRILILQSSGCGHFADAVHAVRKTYPAAELIGLVEEASLTDLRSAGLGLSLHAFQRETPVRTWLPSGIGPVNLCVIPFESRLGVHLLDDRHFPVLHGIGRVASFSRRKQLREYSLVGWRLRNLVISRGMGPIHAPLLWLWVRLQRWTDVAALFGLAVAALVLAGARSITGRLRWQRGIRPASGGRLLVTLFIPSMGLGGAQRQLISFLSRVDRARFEVELALINGPDKFFEPAVRALHVPIVYLNDSDEFWRAGVVRRLARHLRRRQSAVLHSWLHYAVNLGTIAGALAGVPVLVGSYRSERPSRFPWFYPVWQRAMDLLNTPLQTRVIANSEAVRREARRWAWVPERKLLTVYNGVEPAEPAGVDRAHLERLRRDLGLPTAAAVVGIVGRIDPEKDHAMFLRAVQRIYSRRPQVRFLIVGDGRLRSWIEAEIERQGLSACVRVLGRRDDALALIQVMDVLTLTSRTEGFPNVLLEAGQVGTPVVTTAAGGAAEIVEDGETGFVVPCGDDDALAKKVLALLDDPQLAKRLAEGARRRVLERFSADRMAGAITGCYLESLERTIEGMQARPVRICLLSTHVYGLLQPHARLPFGGAEVQLLALARQLAQDSRVEVSVLTGDKGRRDRERHEGLAVEVHPIFAKLQVLTEPFEPESGERKPNASIGSSAQALTDRVRRGLDALPRSAAETIRWPVRAWYRLRRRLPATVLAPGRWLYHRLEEFREWLGWVGALRSVDADVYVMRCAAPQVRYVQAACTFLRRKFVYMVAHEDDVSGAYATAQGIWGQRFERGLCGADAVVCQHEEQLQLLRKRYARVGILIRSLCPVPAGDPLPIPRQHVLWVARMDEWKQPDLFLDLAERIPEASFVMVGPPSHQDPLSVYRLRERMTRLSNLQWHNRLSFDATLRLFEEALVFVNTSRVEGFPNTFLQAAACGTPVVSWMVNPDQLFTRFEFGYCAKGDWVEFESRVRRLCADLAERTRLGENGRRFVRERHDPAVIARQYADLFLRLAGKAGGGEGGRSETLAGLPDLGKGGQRRA